MRRLFAAFDCASVAINELVEVSEDVVLASHMNESFLW